MMTKKSVRLSGRKNVSVQKPEDKTSFSGELILNQIIQSISIAAFVIDTDHIVTHWNKACEILTGIAADAVVGTGEQWKAFYNDRRPVLADLIVDGKKETDVRKLYGSECRRHPLVDDAYETTGFLPDLGEKGRWLYFTAAPLRDSGGGIIGAVETLQDITESRLTEQNLKETHVRLVTEQLAMRKKNLVLREILDQIEHEKKLIMQRVQVNINRVVTPVLKALGGRLDAGEREYIKLLEDTLSEVTSPYIKDLEDTYSLLSPRELEICSMIRNGMSSKSIASALNISPLTVDKQRSSIRNKLDIVSKGVNLKSFLMTNKN